jgi:hypothetical protein
VLIRINALVIKNFLVNDNRLSVLPRDFEELEHQKCARISRDIVAPLHVDVNAVAMRYCLAFLRLNPCLKRRVLEPARPAHFVAAQMQVLVGKDSGELVDEARNDGHELRVGRIQRNAPVLVLGNVGRAGRNVPSIAESEPRSVARHVELRDDPNAQIRGCVDNRPQICG